MDVNNRKLEITAFKKNIDVYTDTTIPRILGSTLKQFVNDKFQYMLTKERVEIMYWLKTPTDEPGSKQAIFSGYKTIIDENGKSCMDEEQETMEGVEKK